MRNISLALVLIALGLACAESPEQTTYTRKAKTTKAQSGKGQSSENAENGSKPIANPGEEAVVAPSKPDPVESEAGEIEDPDPIVPEAPAVEPAPSTLLDAAFITSFMNKIAGPGTKGRGTGQAQNASAAELIAVEFKAAGLQPGGDSGTYFQSFNAKNIPTRNVIGILPGLSDEVIVIGAHMDHLGERNGQIYYGADDNASGTTGLVATAHAFAKGKIKPARTLVFMAFSGEEMGLLGSIHYVKNGTTAVPKNKVKFMMNMDMIGYSNGSVEAISFGHTMEGNRIARELLGKTQLRVTYLNEVDEGGSDHMPFAQAGIPVGVFHTGVHANYHKPTDTVEKIDYKNLQLIAGLAADFVWMMAKQTAFKARPIELEPLAFTGYSKGLHGRGCEPGLADFGEVEANLAELRAALSR